MQIIDNLIILALFILSFLAGMKLSDRYHAKAATEQKNALERQFLRLLTHSDADDPCRPYKFTRNDPPCPQPEYFSSDCFTPNDFCQDDRFTTGEHFTPRNQTPGPPGPISQGFMDDLQQNGCAKTSFRKSDLSK